MSYLTLFTWPSDLSEPVPIAVIPWSTLGTVRCCTEACGIGERSIIAGVGVFCAHWAVVALCAYDLCGRFRAGRAIIPCFTLVNNSNQACKENKLNF